MQSSEGLSEAEAVDWDGLAALAHAAMRKAYAPYSRFPVGAAALLDDGRTVCGCNVENASYGLTLCAECTLLGQIQMTGGGRIRAFACVDGEGKPLMPCGRCRQLLYEFRAPGMQLLTARGIRSIEDILPDAFGPENLEAPEEGP
ncbi:cytidine deaminase [Sinomonas terrae]|uniref:cytidine deaminase n=1 Tax=Sinomonas terrae TaxID=2908838 RepID=UPI002103CF67|nr:cytidine deaminase [Sinomonas terrae]